MEENKEINKEDNKENNGKKPYKYKYGISKFEYQLLWTAIWLVFIFGLCGLFCTATPLWLLIFWLMGSK